MKLYFQQLYACHKNITFYLLVNKGINLNGFLQ